jgi:phosphoribosylglycinamide formyltransferase-1
VSSDNEGSDALRQNSKAEGAECRPPVRLGLLLSGRGSNFLAIAESIRAGRLKGAEIAVVISNVAEARGLAHARELGLHTKVLVSKGRKREEHDADVTACLRESGVDFVCLAGYMRLLSPQFVAAFPHRILNIHPSLLPAFPGLEAQEQAFNYGVKVTGCTVHFVDEELDHGAIVVQRAIPVLDTDDEHSLAERILAEEHLAYTEAIARVVSGEYEVRGRKYVKANT